MPETQPILITGAAGFIGSHLAQRLLAQGQPIVGLDNFCDFYDPAIKQRNWREATNGQQGFTLIQGDIRDRAAVMNAFESHRPKAVIHLAAMAGVRPSIQNPSLYAEVNLNGTVNLLDAAVKVGVSRFLFASSSSVYGNNPKTPFSEDDNVDHPISPYAATKKSGELICHSYHHLYRLPISCLRFFTVFGPRQRPDLAIGKFLRQVSLAKPIPVFGDGSTSRDYTFVSDIVDGITAALERCGQNDRPPFRVYNLGGNHPASLSHLIQTVEQVVGKKAVIDRQPMQMGDVERTWADLTQSQRELDYAPRVSLADGIAAQWAWMQKTVG